MTAAAPNGDVTLAGILDAAAVRSLLQDFHDLTAIPVGIIDRTGRVLTYAGGQETDRIGPTAIIAPGECRLDRRDGNLWDMATPLSIGGQTVGHLVGGPFSFDDGSSRSHVERGMRFLVSLANMLSLLGSRSLQMAEALAEREALAASLRDSVELLNTSQAIAHVGSWVLDVRANRLSWSDEVFRIFGLEPQEFGATYEAFLEAVHPEDRGAVHAAYSASLKDGCSSYEITHRIVRRRTGEVRQVLEKCEHVRDSSGAIVRSVGMVQDVTEERRRQEELERNNRALVAANHAWQQCAFVVSHDLQEPLRTINIYSQMLVRQAGVQEDPQSARCAGFIDGSVRRMEQLLRDLLSFASATEGTSCSDEAADLNCSLRQALTVLGARIHEASAVVRSADLPIVRANEKQLAQVFQNLLSNALKYRRPDAVPEIEISAEANDGEWTISVRDNGVGFDPQYADRIFGLFQRLHRDGYPGTGVGLAICQRIVERYGGRIRATSAGPGFGATVSFTVPACPADIPQRLDWATNEHE